MDSLPGAMIDWLGHCEPAFSGRVWPRVEVLLVGTVLAPGKRTATAVLRVMGPDQECLFQNYHRVLKRATWSRRAPSAVLLQLLVATFVAEAEPVVLGIDAHIERWRGAKIGAKCIYRYPVRSSQSIIVKTSGLRWMCMMLLVEVPWARRVCALPFLTVLASSARYNWEHGQSHKSLTDWARQMIIQVCLWLPS